MAAELIYKKYKEKSPDIQILNKQVNVGDVFMFPASSDCVIPRIINCTTPSKNTTLPKTKSVIDTVFSIYGYKFLTTLSPICKIFISVNSDIIWSDTIYEFPYKNFPETIIPVNGSVVRLYIDSDHPLNTTFTLSEIIVNGSLKNALNMVNSFDFYSI